MTSGCLSGGLFLDIQKYLYIYIYNLFIYIYIYYIYNWKGYQTS